MRMMQQYGFVLTGGNPADRVTLPSTHAEGYELCSFHPLTFSSKEHLDYSSSTLDSLFPVIAVYVTN